MYRVHLTEAQRIELERRTRTLGLPPRTRDRLEMVRLAGAGLNIPRVAALLGRSEQRVRYWLKRFLAGGFDALTDQPHLGQRSQLTPSLLAALRTEVAKGERTWTTRQLAAWLAAEHDVRLSRQQLGTLLRRAGFSYRRSERHLRHKQDPALVAEKRTALVALERGALPGAGTWHI